MEDLDRLVSLLPQPPRQGLAEHDRAVATAGAADGDREPAPPLGPHRPDRERYEFLEALQELPRLRLGHDVVANRLGEAREVSQRGHVIRIAQEASVEHEVGLEGHAELVAEADKLDRKLVRPDVRRELREESLAELAEREIGRVDDDIRVGADRLQDASLFGDRGGDPLVVLERRAVPCLAEAPDQDVVGGLEVGLQQSLGLEQAAATLASVFLDGTRAEASARTPPATTL